MMIRRSLLLVITLGFFLNTPLFAQAGQEMDKTSDRFYVNYNHPRLRQGANLLGTIILQNNNPEGFTLKLVSLNGGVLKVLNANHGSSDINYHITFEAGSGRIGDGVVVNYTQSEMLTDHIILQSTNQLTSTDISIKVYLNIEQEISDSLMAGNYRDEIEILYQNVNPL